MDVLGKGAHSVVFVDEQKTDIVIKEQLNKADDLDWLDRQKRGYNIVKEIQQKNSDVGVGLPELIEVEDRGDKGIIREKRLFGKTFASDENMYWQLSEKTKNDIAKQMAKFLNAMHSSYDCNLPNNSIKEVFDKYKCRLNTADDIIARFNGKLQENIKSKLQEVEQYILNMDMSDEYIVMTHKDLRINNILYDDKTNKISVIDFELAGMDNVYRDFVATAPASSMPWNFTERVIKFYNEIPHKKYPITINLQKVQNMLFYGSMHEYARCVKFIKSGLTEQYFNTLYKKLERVSGISLIKNAMFKNAIKMLKQNVDGVFIADSMKKSLE